MTSLTRQARAHSQPQGDPTPISLEQSRTHSARTSNQAHARTRRRLLLLGGLAIAVIAAAIVALGLGPVAISPVNVVRILCDGLRGADPLPNALVVTQLRLPRILLALVAGAALATAGACMQAYFRNPLADPGITGVASGSAVGAVLIIVTGASAISAWMLPAAAFLGALAVLAVIHLVSLASRDRGPTTILLVGIALNAFCGAITGAVVANAKDAQAVRSAMFWLQGDLSVAKWSDLAVVTLPVVVGLIIALVMTRDLNALMLGEETAQSMGIDVSRTRTILLVMTSVLVGCVVAVTGVIGFVGLVAPHIVRLIIGSDHRVLIPGSALLGALFLVAADTVARLAPGGGSWQTGIVTALAGSPVFLFLVLRSRKTHRSTP